MANHNKADAGPRRRLGARRTPVAEPRTYTVEEAARVVGISRSKAYECVRDGTLPSMRFGKRIVVPIDALEALLGAGGLGDQRGIA